MTAEQWEGRVKECRDSGKSAKAWCKGKGIAYYTYLRWAKKFRQEEGKKEVSHQEGSRQWVNIAAPTKEECGEARGKVKREARREAEGVKLMIIVGKGLQGGEITELLRAVKEVCC